MEIYFLSASEKERIDFDGSTFGISEMDVFRHELSYETKNGVITKFKREISEKEIEINISDDKEGSWQEHYYHLQNIFDKDNFTNMRGKLYVNGYYLMCNVYAGETEDQFRNWCDFQTCTLKIITDRPEWIKEHPYAFKASEVTSTNNKRYAGRYAYRYANGLNNTYITNENFMECNFKMRIYGPCTKPSVYIGGYEYYADIVLQAGEYLEIDTAAETVAKVMISGIRVNAFNNRSFANYVFRKIQTGKQEIFWDGKFDFDLILYEERSEPKWR